MLVARCLQGQGILGAGWSVSEIQQRFYREVAAADLLRPRDREIVEAPDNLEIVTFKSGHPVLPGAEVEEAAAVRGDLYADVDTSSSVPLCTTGSCKKSRGRRLVEHYVRRVDARGADVHVFRPKAQHHVGIDTTRWKWNHVISHRVTPKLHINVLELAAIGLAVKWRLRCQARGGRALHLTDSQVCLSVLSKGRTGSSRLRSGLRRIGARCIGGGLVMTFAFVSSEANPSDAPSRRA